MKIASKKIQVREENREIKTMPYKNKNTTRKKASFRAHVVRSHCGCGHIKLWRMLHIFEWMQVASHAPWMKMSRPLWKPTHFSTSRTGASLVSVSGIKNGRVAPRTCEDKAENKRERHFRRSWLIEYYFLARIPTESTMDSN